jgi:hypothetical protein
MPEIRCDDRDAAVRSAHVVWGPRLDDGPLIEAVPEVFRDRQVRTTIARRGRARVAIPENLAVTGEALPEGENPAPVSSVTVWRTAVLIGDQFFDYALQIRNLDAARAIAAQQRALGKPRA